MKLAAQYINHMGDDLTVCNNARVSFAKESGLIVNEHDEMTLSKGDRSLIRYLANGIPTAELNAFIDEVAEREDEDFIEAKLKAFRRLPSHWVPFANGCNVQFHIAAPISVMRQVFKHKLGAYGSDSAQVESEVSRRYIKDSPDVYIPEFRKAAANVKQGSSDETFTPESTFVPMPVMVNGEIKHGAMALNFEVLAELSKALYRDLIDQGVCAEQSRFALLQGAFTESRITNSLYGWANFYNARSDILHAQREIAELAEQVGEVMSQIYPVSWAALTE